MHHGRNESRGLSFVDQSWSEYVEYILDTLDYIQLHQEDLGEFYQLSTRLLTLLDEKQLRFETIDDQALKGFQEELDKAYEQVELLNQKGELLLQSSAVNVNEDNQVERQLETINKNYDALTMKIKARLQTAEKAKPPTRTTTSDDVSHTVSPSELRMAVTVDLGLADGHGETRRRTSPSHRRNQRGDERIVRAADLVDDRHRVCTTDEIERTTGRQCHRAERTGAT